METLLVIVGVLVLLAATGCFEDRAQREADLKKKWEKEQQMLIKLEKIFEESNS